MSPSVITGIYQDVNEEEKVKSLGYVANEDIVRGLHDMEVDSGTDDDGDVDDDFLASLVLSAKPLDDMFTIEQRDPKHRRGDYLYLLKEVYDRDPGRIGGGETAFFKWVDRLTITQFRGAMLDALKGTRAESIFMQRKTAWFFTDFAAFQAGVKYKGQTQGGLQVSARKYRIEFTDNRVTRLGKMMDIPRLGRKWVNTGKLEPYSTNDYKSNWSGDGWGIWVLGLDGTFYSNRMRVGRFQHSSFLSGGSVGAAGEWQVQDGIIKKISGRSGHYKPRFEQFMYALRELSWKSLICFDRAEVDLFDRLNSTPVTVHAGDLLKTSDPDHEYKLDPHAL